MQICFPLILFNYGGWCPPGNKVSVKTEKLDYLNLCFEIQFFLVNFENIFFWCKSFTHKKTKWQMTKRRWCGAGAFPRGTWINKTKSWQLTVQMGPPQGSSESGRRMFVGGKYTLRNIPNNNITVSGKNFILSFMALVVKVRSRQN